jgi:hypothetical protein
MERLLRSDNEEFLHFCWSVYILPFKFNVAQECRMRNHIILSSNPHVKDMSITREPLFTLNLECLRIRETF